MALLKAIYQSQDEIPVEFQSLYSRREGDENAPWELSEVEGVKTQLDVNRVLEALRKERTDHGQAQSRYTELAGLLGDDASPETLQRILDERAELQARIEAGEGNSGPTDEQIQELVQRKLVVETRPLQRELEALRGENETLKTENVAYKKDEVRRTITSAVLDATQGDKGIKLNQGADEFVVDRALKVLEIDERGEVVTRDGVGITPGLPPREWLAEMRDSGRYPILFPGHTSAGARSSDARAETGNNPFKKETRNVTEIGRLVQADPVRAKRLAQAAGLTEREMRGYGLV